jgi:arylsulfatase A-like enzyme
MSEEQEKKAVAAYYASVAYMDAQVGKVLNTLKEEGLEENTIVIFTSDHGFHLAEHRFWMKVSLLEESTRVPLIIKVPGKEPAVCDSLVELIDLYPTVAELAGLEYSENLQGKSIVKTFDDPGFTVREAAFSMRGYPNRKRYSYLLRTSKWAFIQYDEDGSSGMQLYDMEHDSKQYNNLVYNPGYEKVIIHLKEMLKEKLAEVRDNDLGIDYQLE